MHCLEHCFPSYPMFRKGSMMLLGENSIPYVLWQAASFSNNSYRMEGGWVQTEDLYVITIFFWKHSRKTPGKPMICCRKSPGHPWKITLFDCLPLWLSLYSKVWSMERKPSMNKCILLQCIPILNGFQL